MRFVSANLFAAMLVGLAVAGAPAAVSAADDPPVAEAMEGAEPGETLAPTPVIGEIPGVASLLERSTVSVVQYRSRRREVQDRYDITGTGFFVSAEGHMLTANHVLKQAVGDTTPDADHPQAHLQRLMLGWLPNSSTTKVSMIDNPTGAEMHIVARDLTRDLVLVKVESAPAPPVRFADADVPIGFEVGFLGFPFGNSLGFRPLLHRGSISGRRLLPGIGKKAPPYVGYILDAAVHGGNSGSPVFDIRTGIVVGMVQFRRAETIPLAIGSREIISFLREAGVEPLLAQPPKSTRSE